MAINTSNDLYNTAGIRIPTDACVVIVRTEWNSDITLRLENGCRKIFDSHKVQVQTIVVPGAFEIAFAIKSYWEKFGKTKEKPLAFIALGCVIKGDTPHFEYVCKAVTEGIVQLNLLLPVPTIFGVLTVDIIHQAEERLGGKHGHKGEEAAIAALKMISLF
jgi:6,7-dimethyl-8-ribityllumazine synthase